jgi:dTDP-glucose 4,6-dehydratase
MPIITTNCSNNYGPNQYREKLIPLIIHNALKKKKLPIYGNGKQIRDWLYVGDHCNAILKIFYKGKVGEVYNIGGQNEIRNLDLVKKICIILDKKMNLNKKEDSHLNLIQFVKDRPGHDFRYSINLKKITKQLKWKPYYNFDKGLRITIDWYLKNLK